MRHSFRPFHAIKSATRKRSHRNKWFNNQVNPREKESNPCNNTNQSNKIFGFCIPDERDDQKKPHRNGSQHTKNTGHFPNAMFQHRWKPGTVPFYDMKSSVQCPSKTRKNRKDDSMPKQPITIKWSPWSFSITILAILGYIRLISGRTSGFCIVVIRCANKPGISIIWS